MFKAKHIKDKCQILTASAITLGKITTLDHEILNNPMEFAALVALSFRLLSQLDEILYSLRDGLAKNTNDKWANVFFTNFYLKGHLVIIET